jgi:dTDP-4-dehydrorhamnose 3,5-epimerase
MELLRCDDEIFERFGQVYVTTGLPGVVKAWHYHKKQTDNLAVVHGMVKIVLCDGRKRSSTYREVNEFFTGIHNPILIKIPPLVFHGFKCIGETEAIIINCPTRPYNSAKPDEFRLPAHTKSIPYKWERRDG